MPTKIDPNYKPSDRVFKLLAVRFPELSFDRAREFVGHEMDEFMLYWEGTGKPKANWDSTCLNWMKRTYEDKKENLARNRTYGGMQENAFEKVMDNIGSKSGTISTINKVNPNPPTNFKTIPAHLDLPPMNTDDALAELRKLTGG